MLQVCARDAHEGEACVLLCDSKLGAAFSLVRATKVRLRGLRAASRAFPYEMREAFFTCLMIMVSNEEAKVPLYTLTYLIWPTHLSFCPF